MRLLTVEHVPPARRRSAAIWYPAVMLSLSGESLKRTGLEFDVTRDDLGELSYAYVEVEGIPVMLTRREAEQPHTYTLMIDARSVAERLPYGAAGFARGVLSSLHITPPEVIWKNDELDALFPANLKKRLPFEQVDIDQIEPVPWDTREQLFTTLKTR